MFSDPYAKKSGEISSLESSGKDKGPYSFQRGFQEARGSVKQASHLMMSDGESKAASEFTNGRLIKTTQLINDNMIFNQPDSALLKNIDAIIKKEGGHDQQITARIRSNFQKAMF